MEEWLTSVGLPIPEGVTKAMLYENCIKPIRKEHIKYDCVEIAKEYGQTVSYTPPYHPELQPIELVWAWVKNPVAASPVDKMTELKARITANLVGITEHKFLQARAKALKAEEYYLSHADQEEIGSDDEDGHGADEE